MRVPYLAEGLVMLLTAWIWLNEFRYPDYMRRMRAVGYGLVMALIQLTGTLLFGQETLRWLAETSDVGEWVPPWVGEILAGQIPKFTFFQRETIQRTVPKERNNLEYTETKSVIRWQSTTKKQRNYDIMK